jgi:hypothetical protein
MVHPEVGDGGNHLQIWRVAGVETTGRRSSCSLGFPRRANTSSLTTLNHPVVKYLHGASKLEGLFSTSSATNSFRSQWPRGLRHELSLLTQTLGLWVRIPLEAWMTVCVYSVFMLSCMQVAALRRADPPHLCKKKGRAVAQAVSRWLTTAAVRVRTRVWSCGICGGQSGAGADFLRVLRFPLPIFIPPIAPQSPSSIIWGLYIRPEVVAVPSGLSPTPLIIIKNCKNIKKLKKRPRPNKGL